MVDHPKSLPERFLRTILASRFLTVSALLHLLIVILFGGNALIRNIKPPDVPVPSGSIVDDSIDHTPPPPTPQEVLPPAPAIDSTLPPPPPQAPGPSIPPTISTSDLGMSDFKYPQPLAPSPGHIWTPGPAPGQQTTDSGMIPGLPGPMNQRVGIQRLLTGKRFGGGDKAETAVMRSLRWLQSQQQTDGFWPDEGYKGAMTGLALLCFLGHGETPATSNEFGLVVSKGIDALADYANTHDSNLGFSDGFATQEAVYEHAICVYALSEAYTMTKNPKLVPIIQKAVSYIVNGQCPSGGWFYHYAQKPGTDTSVAGWQIQALKAAHLTGIAGLDNVPATINKGIAAIDGNYSSQNGAFGYGSPGTPDYRLTGVGVLCKLFWLGRVDKTVRGGIKDIKTKKLDYDGPDCDLYTWYYDTQACFQMQGDTWDWWNHQFQDILINKQNADGSWPPHGGNEIAVGSLNDSSIRSLMYRTTLCTLMLEVFYRYLPTTRDANGSMQDL